MEDKIDALISKLRHPDVQTGAKYKAWAKRADELEALWRGIIAEELGPHLAREIVKRANAIQQIEQRRELAKWANEEFRRYHVGIECPKKHVASYLSVTGGHHPTVGRYVFFQYGHPRNGNSEISFTSDLFPSNTSVIPEPLPARKVSLPELVRKSVPATRSLNR